MKAKIVGLFVSDGGVPKLPIEHGFVSFDGLEGDRQRNLKYHGGPERALCLYSREVIEILQNEGHPIAPGTTGENILISGLDWKVVKPGARLKMGAIAVEIMSMTTPCNNIKKSFTDGKFGRVYHGDFPDMSRVYVRVLDEGELRVGDEVSLID